MYFVSACASSLIRPKSLATALVIGVVVSLSACSDSDDPSTMVGSGENLPGVPSNGDPGVDLLPTVNPNDAVPDASEDNIADNLLKRSDYQVLLRLIEEADLTEALQGDNSGMGWTLFAPSDDAFGTDAFDALTATQTNALVRSHIHSGRLLANELMPGTLTMSEGTIQIAQDTDMALTVGGASIVARDRVMSNGVIHFVDSILDVQ